MITAGPLSTADLAATVRASIRGDVVTADEPSFPAATFSVRGATPELAVIASDVVDVARTVRLAARFGRRVVAAVPGRRTVIAGESTILVVTRLLATVSVDPARRTATVGIGASWRQVLDVAEPFGLTALSATAGIGRERVVPAARPPAFGFAADRIRSFEVIAATGDRRRIGPDDPDFRALRAGQTAPGLVVAMSLDLVPHPALTVAELTFAATEAPRVLAGWQRWSARLPQSAISGAAPSADGATLVIRLAHVGERHQADALLASLRAAVGAPALAESSGPTTVAAVARGRTASPRAALAA